MAFPTSDIVLKEDITRELYMEKHINFLSKYSKLTENDYEYCATEYMRMSAVYWGLTALDLLGALETVSRDEVLQFIKRCKAKNGGFSAAEQHDAHVLHTLSALQLLALLDAIDLRSGTLTTIEGLDLSDTPRYVASLQRPDGSFAGDEFGEVDTRFSLCALGSLRLLGQLNDERVDRLAAARYIEKCGNFDGAFGCRPRAESHAAYTYTALGSLALLGSLPMVTESQRLDRTVLWLSERQVRSGGLNGRPQKLPDACYGWWVIASLAILRRSDAVDADRLARFTSACQDDEDGGFADRPGDQPDPFHTLFGLAGLSLLGDSRLKPINPALCLPEHVLLRYGITDLY